MNKIINVLVGLIISISMFAQTDYYYFKGQRIPLTVNPKKINVISMATGPQFAPAANPNALPAGLEVEAVIPGNPYNMCIIENVSTNTSLLNNYLNSIVNPNYNIFLPCYFNSTGEEYIVTGNIYVKLRNVNQITTLQSMASTYRINIISQDSNMPLWYTVSITQQTPYNTIQMANILYETGAFLAVEPEFICSWVENIYRPEILVVGAINSSGNRESFSCYGDCLDVVAPGVNILSTIPGNDIDSEDGTSMAAPHVSGIAALILELNPDLTGQQVRDIIEQNTTKVGHLPYQTVSNRPNGTWNEEYGYGLIDAYKALLATPRKLEEY